MTDPFGDQNEDTEPESVATVPASGRPGEMEASSTPSEDFTRGIPVRRIEIMFGVPRAILLLVCLLISTVVWSGWVNLVAAESRIDLSTTYFRLISSRDRDYVVQFTENELEISVTIPKEWLVPAEHEFENFVSSFNYDQQIISFPIGNDEIGLHISSYGLQREGSAQAAAGRDVFLIYIPKSRTVRQGFLDLGVTKWRVRDGGCYRAEMSHFLLADINDDDLVDIGVVSEVMQCEDYYNEERMVDITRGPYYVQHPVLWYVFTSNHWVHVPNYDTIIPKSYTELPLTGLGFGPVDFSGFAFSRSYDPSNWMQRMNYPPPYLPSYRRKLIE